nr:MAG TPA: hypothetical protein [Caudoviricetes sp.]
MIKPRKPAVKRIFTSTPKKDVSIAVIMCLLLRLSCYKYNK